MARIVEPAEEQKKEHEIWLKERPENVRLVAEKFDPWSLYRMKSTGSRVTIYSFDEHEDGITLTVNVSGDFNLVLFARLVFGVVPDDLEECDLPADGEEIGALMTHEEVEVNLDSLQDGNQDSDFFLLGVKING